MKKKNFIEVELKVMNYAAKVCLYDSISTPNGTYNADEGWDTWENG